MGPESVGVQASVVDPPHLALLILQGFPRYHLGTLIGGQGLEGEIKAHSNLSTTSLIVLACVVLYVERWQDYVILYSYANSRIINTATCQPFDCVLLFSSDIHISL